MSLTREILRLAVPTLGALLAEPVFLLIDAAIVGHLGTAELAGVGIASTVLATLVGLSVFLAYGTTAAVARALGAGDLGRGLTAGVAGLYLAAGIGVALIVVGLPSAHPVLAAFQAGPDETAFGVTFLRWSLLGLPGMLVVLASTGVLRGLQDTRTPLLVAVAGAVVNTALNLLLVVGAGWGVAGSAIGTALTQTAMGVVLAVVVTRAARRHGTPLRPDLSRIGGAGRAGFPLLLRTVTLRLAVISTAVVAAQLGVAALAAHQVVMALFNLLALALDALAIAAQALTGRALGEGDARRARQLTRTLLWWGVGAGLVLTAVFVAGHGIAGNVFTDDPSVRAAIAAGVLVLALAQPLAGWVFVLDGVLIGAGDGPYLAWAGLVNLLVYLPAVAAVAVWAPAGPVGLAWLWAAFMGAFLGSRAVTLGVRYRGDTWLVLGAART